MTRSTSSANVWPGWPFCDEIVVLIDRCGGGSRDVALRHTDRVIEDAWPIEGAKT